MEGLVLSSPISNSGIISNSTINQFTKDIEANMPDDKQLLNSKIKYQRSLINELFDFVTILRRINYCHKICREHAESLLGNPAQYFETLSRLIKDEMIEVSIKFLLEVEKLSVENKSPEENAVLQERIKKACTYFYNKFEEKINSEFSQAGIETDNKTVRKSITQAYEFLQQELAIKAACLLACKEGFGTKLYLETRAKASIEQPEKMRRVKLEADVSMAEMAHPEVFAALKTWRSAQAHSQNIPHYMILSQKALVSLAQFLPNSTTDLKNIKGIGKKSIEKYGEEIIHIILTYCEEHHIEAVMPQPESRPIKKKKTEKNTTELSYEMFQTGKTVEEIAAARNLVIATIEGHLAHYIRTGDIDINKLVPEEKIARISEYFIKAGNANLKPAKEAMGEGISYSELRIVLNHLQFLGKMS